MILDALARVPGALAVLVALQPAEEGIRFFSLSDPEPEHGLAWFVLNAFLFVGVAIVVALGIGIAFGGFRVWLLEKFPNNRFNGQREDDPRETFSLRDSRE